MTDVKLNDRELAMVGDALDDAALMDRLAAALSRIMDYACTGAAVRDVDTTEQPQFVEAYAAIREYEKAVMRSRGEI